MCSSTETTSCRVGPTRRPAQFALWGEGVLRSRMCSLKGECPRVPLAGSLRRCSFSCPSCIVAGATDVALTSYLSGNHVHEAGASHTRIGAFFVLRTTACPALLVLVKWTICGADIFKSPVPVHQIRRGRCAWDVCKAALFLKRLGRAIVVSERCVGTRTMTRVSLCGSVCCWLMPHSQMADTVNLLSSDGKSFTVLAKVASMSKTLRDLMEDGACITLHVVLFGVVWVVVCLLVLFCFVEVTSRACVHRFLQVADMRCA